MVDGSHVGGHVSQVADDKWLPRVRVALGVVKMKSYSVSVDHGPQDASQEGSWLGQDILDDIMFLDPGESHVEPLELVGEAAMIDAKAV